VRPRRQGPALTARRSTSPLDARLSAAVPLSPLARQNLVAPAVVGALLGALAAFAVAAVHSEYGAHMAPLYPGITGLTAEALVTFALVAIATVIIWGCVPFLISTLASRRSRGPDV
jgi:hypothetical protein